MIEALLIYIAVVVSIIFYRQLFPYKIKISPDIAFNSLGDGSTTNRSKKSFIAPVGNNVELLSKQLDELKLKKNIRRFQHKEK